MDDVSITVQPEDAQLILTVMNQVNCQGKEGAIQLLRIIHAIEKALKDEE
jgi:hypothetical protein